MNGYSCLILLNDRAGISKIKAKLVLKKKHGQQLYANQFEHLNILKYK